MKIQIGANYLVPKSAPAGMIAALRGALTFTNPDRRSAYQPFSLCFLTETPEGFTVPRGALSVVQDAARYGGAIIEWNSDRVVTRSTRRIPLEDLGIPLRAHQIEAVNRLLDRRQGLAEMPCGAGKTVAGAAALVSSGEPGIVFVHKIDLVDQWVKTLDRMGADRIRVIGGDSRSRNFGPLADREIAVCTIQTLTRSDADAMLGSAGAVIVDEAHHAPADTWEPLIQKCPARFRWGLTATKERSDGWTFLLGLIFGPTIYSIGAKELIERGLLVMPLFVPVLSGWGPHPEQHYLWNVPCSGCRTTTQVNWRSWSTGELPCENMVSRGSKRQKCGTILTFPNALAERDQLDYVEASTAMASDEARQGVCVSLTLAASRLRRRTLILIGRVGATTSLAARLRSAGVAAAPVSSDTPKIERSRRISQLRSGALDSLIATQLADEGLDIPELDTMICGNPTKSAATAVQRGGRSARIKVPGSHRPIVFDLVDDADTFRSHWAKRRAGYIEAYGESCIGSRKPMSLDAALDLLSAESTPLL